MEVLNFSIAGRGQIYQTSTWHMVIIGSKYDQKTMQLCTTGRTSGACLVLIVTIVRIGFWEQLSCAASIRFMRWQI